MRFQVQRYLAAIYIRPLCRCCMTVCGGFARSTTHGELVVVSPHFLSSTQPTRSICRRLHHNNTSDTTLVTSKRHRLLAHVDSVFYLFIRCPTRFFCVFPPPFRAIASNISRPWRRSAGTFISVEISVKSGFACQTTQCAPFHWEDAAH
jgi:hypothetical protein